MKTIKNILTPDKRPGHMLREKNVLGFYLKRKVSNLKENQKNE